MSTSNNKKTWIWWAIVIIAAIGLIWFVCSKVNFKLRNRTIVDNSYMEGLYSRVETAESDYWTIYSDHQSSLGLIDTLKAKLQVASDSIAELDSLLNKCKGVKKSTKKANQDGAKKKTVKKPVVNNQKKTADLVDPNSFKPTGSKESSTYKTNLDGKKYSGLKDGDFYTTISKDNFLLYVFKKKLYDEAGGTGTPELNDKGSKKVFVLVGDEYVYEDKRVPITTANLNRVYSWTVFIGDKDGYSAFVPHELIKPQIIEARGELAGTISAEDVTAIGKLVPEVKAGRIQPNKVTGVGSYDGLTYEGWHFTTKLMYQED